MRHPDSMPKDASLVEIAAEALLDPALEPIVDLVVTADETGYEARAVDGRVRFSREDDGHGWRFREVQVEGRNPLGDRAVDRFSPLADEQANPHPSRAQTSYPYAYEMVAQVFDAPSAPDLICQHTGAHNWEDHGGERGEHGSMGIVQARAPFILAGAGVRAHGMLDRACRLVDVAPTVLAAMGGAPHPEGVGLNGRRRDDALLRRQDGEVQDDLLDDRGPKPDHAMGFLFDGCNPNVLYDMVEAGEAPNVARLMAMGSTYRYGAMSSSPTVTLANHTGVLTGCHPGHHGVLNNAWWDRQRGEQIITNSPDTWAWSMATLSPEVETLYAAVKRTWPDSFTLSCNEPCDAGADFGTFVMLRGGRMPTRPPRAEDLPFATERFVRPEKKYSSASRVDHIGLEMALGVWGEGYQGEQHPLPRFTWVNFSLTDAAFHLGGPYSEVARASVHDTDARLGEILDAVERRGVLDRTLFFLVADHGMEDSDPGVTGDWAPALDATGIPYRDEAYMWIYTGVS
ncbi:MAG: alkaline phosphatase family protein [Actinobacteria bacterium]|nr:alkaline phosphatase family protein [Actinomycetota bacterium]